MFRPSAAVCLIALGPGLVGCVAACGGSSGHAAGPFLRMVNDTPVVVTMKLCTGNTSVDQTCAAAKRVAPAGSADFPLPGARSQVRMVVIRGYGPSPVCFTAPPASMLRMRPGTHATVRVTQVRAGECFGAAAS